MKANQIKGALAYAKKSMRNIAVDLGQTPANLSQKLNRETFKDDELQAIAQAIGAEYHCYFQFPDGTKI